MENTVGEVPAWDSGNEILLKKQTKENFTGEKPPPYETLFSSTQTPIQESESRYQNRNTRRVVHVQSTAMQSMGHIESYIYWSTFNILYCCLCFGCIACCYGQETQRLKEENNYEDALKASKKARKWNTIATVSGITLFLLQFFYMFLRLSS
ncbi:unnamed protein product [Rotaria magnacalcarata]|uniref:Uncharacterized protein n=1 Tax=Rotaria magnacalcarata TaxID=392030 RepID=A0A815Z4R6_9BILA|nr:unnamed protein product [Rotaria magnacalcarata]